VARSAGAARLSLSRRWSRRWRARLSPEAAAAVLLLGLVVVAVIAAPLLAPRDSDAQDLAHRLAAPGPGALLGTDSLGRDVFSRVLYGGRVSLLVAIAAVVLSGAAGSLLGLAAGFFGGWFDSLVMRVVDVWQAVPYLALALAMAVVLGPGLQNVVLVLAVSSWPTFARVVRGQTLGVRASESVLAAYLLGATNARIIRNHVLPQVLGTIIVLCSLLVPSMILFEASLSFLGVGVQRPTPSWGNMLLDGVDVLDSAWWVSIVPGVAILLAVLAVNVLGDWLRDALDPLRGVRYE
jgi:peptide/nickel transport system permease protein